VCCHKTTNPSPSLSPHVRQLYLYISVHSEFFDTQHATLIFTSLQKIKRKRGEEYSCARNHMCSHTRSTDTQQTNARANVLGFFRFHTHAISRTHFQIKTYIHTDCPFSASAGLSTHSEVKIAFIIARKEIM